MTDKTEIAANRADLSHYYGDIVRMLFLGSAMVMTIGLPIFTDYTGVPVPFSVFSILILGVAAGFTNPKLLWGAAVNSVLSIFGLIIFETYAVSLFIKYGQYDKFFLSNLALGFVFLFAVYFSTKTLRGLWLKRKEK